MDPDRLGRFISEDERQRVEFKKSLQLVKDCAKAAVAFANAQGGHVLVGVRPDGTVLGVQMGKFNQESFANGIESYIYPHLPLYVEAVEIDEKSVVVVEVPADRPPIIGAYLLANHRLQPREPVEAIELQAYRRVGRSSQQVDFMWLRPQLPSDPLLEIVTSGQTRGPYFPTEIGGNVWAQEASGPAYELSFHMDPDAAGKSTSSYLVYPQQRREITAAFSFNCAGVSSVPDQVSIAVRYRDARGCVWESGRVLRLNRSASPGASVENTAEAYRRIIRFPPKLA